MVSPCSDRISRVPPYSNLHVFEIRTGLSPTMARLSSRFQLENMKHWPGPRSLATTNGVLVDVLSSGYLDVSVPQVSFCILCIQIQIPSCDLCKSEARASPLLAELRVRDSKLQRSKVGSPIRKSADQSLFATPHGLSQRTTSFIASQRQGIHRTPLRHLIALIIEDRSEGSDRFRSERPFASNISKSFAVKRDPRWSLAFLKDRSPFGSDWICFLFTMTDSTRSQAFDRR